VEDSYTNSELMFAAKNNFNKTEWGDFYVWFAV